MVGHSVPGVVSPQNLHRHLSLLQQFTDEDRDQILCFQRIARNFFLKELFEAFLQYIQKLRSQSPHVHGNQRIHINHYAVCFCSGCRLYNVLSLNNLSQIVLLVHFADTTSHAAVIGQCVFQHKACHARLATIHQILMDGFEAFLSIVIICIYDNERGLDDILCCKDCLTRPPRLCPSFRQSSRNVIDILESVVYSYVVRGANGGNAIADNLFKFLLNILTYNKYYMIETSFNRIVDRVVHNDMSSIIHWL